jgi:hypothetical protein
MRPDMTKYDGIERRNSRVQGMSLLVEIGINYSRTIGRQKALSYFLENDIPHDVVTRVLKHAERRRLTRWECSLDEIGLRRALGARPLLSAQQLSDDNFFFNQ